jgi:hypothetical protein
VPESRKSFAAQPQPSHFVGKSTNGMAKNDYHTIINGLVHLLRTI